MPSWLLRRLRNDRRLLELWIAVGAILFASIIIGSALWTSSLRTESLDERARRLAAAGDHESAERLYWRALRGRSPDIETLIGFIDNHAELRHQGEDEMFSPGPGPDRSESPLRGVVSEAQIERLLSRQPENVHVLAGYWYRVRLIDPKTESGAAARLADLQPPIRWANHLLGRAALMTGDAREAARRFDREGLAFPVEARRDLKRALAIWSHVEAWDEIRARVKDRRYASAIGPALRLKLAAHDGRWPEILRWLWPASFEGVEPWPLFLAAVAAILWFGLAARMGRLHDKVPGRGALYLTAFALGVLSIYPTLVVITIEESIFSLRVLGHPLPDLIYFVFGVGLREELAKLLLFLPLLPLLRRRRSRLEAITCGALVGLGFAAEENIVYFHRMDMAAALSRFLTANFMHMSLTALVASAAYEGSHARPGSRDSLQTMLPLAVVLHGAYDFLLVTSAGIFAMAIFIVLAQQFLRLMMNASSREEQDDVFRLFVGSLAILAGVSYIYAATRVGPAQGFAFIASGLLGMAIMIYMFVREMKA